MVDGEASDWAAAIFKLVHDPALRRRIGDSAAETIRERWTIDHAADAMIVGLSLGASAVQRGRMTGVAGEMTARGLRPHGGIEP